MSARQTFTGQVTIKGVSALTNAFIVQNDGATINFLTIANAGGVTVNGPSSSSGIAFTILNNISTLMFRVTNDGNIFGGSSTASATGGSGAIALGNQSVASGLSAIALGGSSGGGSGALASGNNSFAVGYGTTAAGQYSIAIGSFPCAANARNSIAIGEAVRTAVTNKFAIGYGDSSSAVTAIVLMRRRSVVLNSAATASLFINTGSTTYSLLSGAFDGYFSVLVTWNAYVTAAGSGTAALGDVISGIDFFFCRSLSGVGKISTVNRITTATDTSMASANMSYSYTHSGTTGTLNLTFTAPTTANGTTFNIFAKVETVEC